MPRDQRLPALRIDRSKIVERFEVTRKPQDSAVYGILMEDGRTLFGCKGGCDEAFPTAAVAYRHRYFELPHKPGGPVRPVIDDVTLQGGAPPVEAPAEPAALVLPGFDQPEPGEKRPRRRDVGREAILNVGARELAGQAVDFINALVESREEAIERAERLQEENDRLRHMVNETRRMWDIALGGTA